MEESNQEELQIIKKKLDKFISNYKAKFKTQRGDFNDVFEKAKNDLQTIENLRQEHQELMETQRNDANNLKSEIETIGKAKSELQTIENLRQEHQELMETQQGDANNLKSEIENISENIKKQQQIQLDNINNFQEEKEIKFAEIEELDKKHRAASAAELEEMREQAAAQRNDINEKTQTEFQDVEQLREDYKELFAEVEKLLPGATTAGLATSYVEAQQREKKKYRALWTGFILALAGLFVIGYGEFFDFILETLAVSGSIKGFDNFGTTENEWSSLISRIFMALPFIWLAWYCQRSISQINRLREEYQHKEKVMRTYESFIRQLKGLSTENSDVGIEMQKNLLDVTIAAIERNPAEILHPSETFVEASKPKLVRHGRKKEEGKNDGGGGN